MNKQKNKKVIETIRSIYSSLDSHLEHIHGKDSTFHKKTIKEYARDLKNLCDLL
jgi:hypothetical protein